jgi:hypothetical protein
MTNKNNIFKAIRTNSGYWIEKFAVERPVLLAVSLFLIVFLPSIAAHIYRDGVVFVGFNPESGERYIQRSWWGGFVTSLLVSFTVLARTRGVYFEEKDLISVEKKLNFPGAPPSGINILKKAKLICGSLQSRALV